jgi:hypothetical protein
MRHPFDLSLDELLTQDLEFEEILTDDDSQIIGGRLLAMTLAFWKDNGQWRGRPYPKSTPYPRPISYPKPPTVTTQALGEEGGSPFPPEVTTMALGEEGGDLIY